MITSMARDFLTRISVLVSDAIAAPKFVDLLDAEAREDIESRRPQVQTDPSDSGPRAPGQIE